MQLQPISPDLPIVIKNVQFTDEGLFCSEHAELKNIKVVIKK